MPEPIEVLGAMITPAVLISAAALLILSTSNHFGRVIERIRLLIAECERLATGQHTPSENEKHVLILDQVENLLRRLLLLRTAVTGLYVTITLLPRRDARRHHPGRHSRHEHKQPCVKRPWPCGRRFKRWITSTDSWRGRSGDRGWD